MIAPWPTGPNFLKNAFSPFKREISALGDLRPGALSLQYNVCGSPSCRCKADPPLKHGPYPQISFTWRGKSTTQSVGADEVDEVRRQLKNYHQLRNLADEWIDLALEWSRLRLRERRNGAEVAEKRAEKRKNPAKSQAPS